MIESPETASAEDNVVKCLAPLTVDDADLDRGLDILSEAIPAAMA